MPRSLRRFHQSRQSHFVTFSCYRRQRYFTTSKLFELFVECLEETRRRFDLCVYGYVVIPEHVHLLLSEPAVEDGEPPGDRVRTLADALHFLKLAFAKRARKMRSAGGPFWQKRYYDRNVRDRWEFGVKLEYLHWNPVKRGLVGAPEEWRWSSYRHYALREMGLVEIESEWVARDRESGGARRIFLRVG